MIDRIDMIWCNMAVCQNPRYPCSSHQNSWDLWMFIPLKMVCIGIDPYPYDVIRCNMSSFKLVRLWCIIKTNGQTCWLCWISWILSTRPTFRCWSQGAKVNGRDNGQGLQAFLRWSSAQHPSFPTHHRWIPKAIDAAKGRSWRYACESHMPSAYLGRKWCHAQTFEDPSTWGSNFDVHPQS